MSIFLITFSVFSFYLSTFFSFLLLIFYHLHAFLEEALLLLKRYNFPDQPCYLYRLPTERKCFVKIVLKLKKAVYQNKILPVHVFLSSSLLVPNIHRDFLKVICQLPHSKQIQDLALLIDILQSANKIQE